MHFDWNLDMNCNWRSHWGEGIQNIQYRDCHKTFHDVAIDLEVLACFKWTIQCQVLTHPYNPMSSWPIHEIRELAQSLYMKPLLVESTHWELQNLVLYKRCIVRLKLLLLLLNKKCRQSHCTTWVQLILLFFVVFPICNFDILNKSQHNFSCLCYNNKNSVTLLTSHVDWNLSLFIVKKQL